MSARRLLWCGVIGSVLFSLVWLVEGAVRPDYDPMRSWVSELALSDRGWIQIANFLVSGGLIIAFGRGLRTAVEDGPAATWGPRMVLITGVSLLAAGLFVIDPGTYRPSGTAAEVTWHGVLHDIAGPMVALSVATAAFGYSRRFARGYGRTTGSVMIALWLAAGVLNGLDHAGVWSPAPAGLLQRLALLTGFAYLAYLAHRVRTAPAPTVHPAKPAPVGADNQR